MSSVDKQINNSIILTLYESQICQNNKSYLPYSLSVNYNNNITQETNVIKTLKHSIHSNKFIFTLTKKKKKNIHQIIITGYTKTMFIIKNTFCKVIIRFNISKIGNNKTQWYFLKDNNDEIVMKILLSLTIDNPLHQYNSMSSLEKINNNILISSQSQNNLSSNVNYFNSKLFMNRSMVNLHSFSIIHHLRMNSNQLISILENENDNNGTMCDNSVISNSTFGNSNNTIFYPNSNLLEIIDEKYNINLDLIKNKIVKKEENLSELERKIDDNKYNISSLERTYKRRKNILEKEKNKLGESIKNFYKMKSKYENHNISLCEKARILERSILRDELINEIENNNKLIFNQISSLFINNNNIEINDLTKNKKKVNKKSNSNSNKNNYIFKNINNIQSRTNSYKKIKNNTQNEITNNNNNIKNNNNNNNSSLFNLNKKKNLKLNYSLKFLNSSKLKQYCFNESNKSECNLKRNHSSKIKYGNKINLKTLLNIQSPKKNETKNKLNNLKSPIKPNKIIKETKNKIVEFDNIKIITIKSSSSKLNIHTKQIIKKSGINLSKQKKKISKKKSLNKILSQNQSNKNNNIQTNNNSNYVNQNSNFINTCIINL